MSLPQFLAALMARWRSASIAFAVVIGLVLVAMLIMPKRYTATASVIVDVKGPDPITGSALQPGALSGYMATQVDVLQSSAVARKVIERLQLAGKPELREDWQSDTGGRGDFEGWLVEQLGKYLTVRPSRDSGAVTVSYRAADPAFAAAMANAYVQAFIDTSVELRTAPAREYTEFFDDRARQARERLDAAQQKLSALQREKGLLGNDERLDIENARLQELSTQVVTLQAAVAESAGRASVAVNSGDRAQEVNNNQTVAALRIDLGRQQTRLEELTSRLGDANPQVVEVRATIADLRRRLAAETERVAGGVALSSNVAQSRLAQAQAALAEQRARVLAMKADRDQVTLLQRDVESAQLAYQAVLQRANVSSVEAQSTRTNASFLERAYVPSEPSSPRLLLGLALGLVLALAAAIGTALVREVRDRRVRTETDLVELVGLPLLADIPHALGPATSLPLQAMPGRPRLADLGAAR